QHRCVNYRHGSGDVYRWELDKGDQSVVVAVNGPLITNDIGLLTRAALDGVGLAFLSDEQARPHLESGALIRVLEDWSPPFPGFFLYYPSRKQQPAALAALVDTLCLENRRKGPDNIKRSDTIGLDDHRARRDKWLAACDMSDRIFVKGGFALHFSSPSESRGF